MKLRHLAVVGVIATSIVACGGLAAADRGPVSCQAAFSAVRCENMAGYAAQQLGTSFEDIASITVLPPPTPEVSDGAVILHVTSGGPPVDTLVTLKDGSVHPVSMGCGGIPALQCRDDPELQAMSVTSGGYFDTPCPGAAPSGCATPVPPPDAAGLAASEPLRVPQFDIAIDHDGHYEVRVGEARLPNGILSTAEFGFAVRWPPGVTIASGSVTLQVRSLDDPAHPFTNIHDHPRVAGAERVEAVLIFDVRRHQPGAVLPVRDVLVR